MICCVQYGAKRQELEIKIRYNPCYGTLWATRWLSQYRQAIEIEMEHFSLLHFSMTVPCRYFLRCKSSVDLTVFSDMFSSDHHWLHHYTASLSSLPNKVSGAEVTVYTLDSNIIVSDDFHWATDIPMDSSDWWKFESTLPASTTTPRDETRQSYRCSTWRNRDRFSLNDSQPLFRSQLVILHCCSSATVPIRQVSIVRKDIKLEVYYSW